MLQLIPIEEGVETPENGIDIVQLLPSGLPALPYLGYLGFRTETADKTTRDGCFRSLPTGVLGRRANKAV